MTQWEWLEIGDRIIRADAIKFVEKVDDGSTVVIWFRDPGAITIGGDQAQRLLDWFDNKASVYVI